MRGLGVVRRHAPATGIDIAEHGCRVAVAADSGAAQPAFAVERIGRPPAALEQHHAKPGLGVAVPGLRGDFEVMPRLCIVRRASIAFGAYAEQVMRGGQACFRGAGELGMGGHRHGRSVRAYYQRNGIAKPALRATLPGRLAVPAERCVWIAQIIGSGRKDEGEHCLRIRCTRLGRATRPERGRMVIGLGILRRNRLEQTAALLHRSLRQTEQMELGQTALRTHVAGLGSAMIPASRGSLVLHRAVASKVTLADDKRRFRIASFGRRNEQG
ncbi:hypothetical protein [Mesorhizobium sp. KR2-14]|uniref:hypothetical protein n=1 Tax=Mesorhizobium sp. KR2-14 TaxID=3156610 RepID=UPI0032B32A2C